MRSVIAKGIIDLQDIGTPFLQDVVKLALGHFIPLDRNILRLRDHIPVGGILFGKRVVRTDRDTLEYGRPGRIGHGGHIHVLSIFGCTGQAESQAFYQAVLSGFPNLDGAELAQIGNVQSDERTGVIERDRPLGIAVRLIIGRHLGLFYDIVTIDDLVGLCIARFIRWADHSDFFSGQIIDGELCATEVLPGFGIGFQDFNIPLFEPVIGIDRGQAAVCGINGDLPFALCVWLIVEREGRLDHSVSPVRNICRFGISPVIGRTDGGHFCTRQIVDRENGAFQRSIRFGCLFVDLDIALFQFVDGFNRHHTLVGGADRASPLFGP